MTQLWVVRHGPTAWSEAGRHTGRTDIPLTVEGEREARALAPRLAAAQRERPFDDVLASPLQRARRTAELAGFGHARPEPLAVEWDYGDYEGLTRAQIREQVPGWSPWSHPALPGGEHLDDVAKRAATLLAALRLTSGPDGADGPDSADGPGEERRVLLFAHGHFLRILAATWIGQEPQLAAGLALDPATISVLGLDRGTPVIERWNS